MPGITYMLQFTHRDAGDIPETIEYIALSDAWEAWEAFRLFAEPESSEIYTRIDLIAHNWEDSTEAHIASMTLSEPYSF